MLTAHIFNAKICKKNQKLSDTTQIIPLSLTKMFCTLTKKNNERVIFDVLCQTCNRLRAYVVSVALSITEQ